MLDKPEVESTKEVVDHYTDVINTKLKQRGSMVELTDAVHKVTECWAGNNVGLNTWSRRARMYSFSTGSGEIDIYLSRRDSMKSMFSYFEALLGELPGLEFTTSVTFNQYVCHEVTYNGCKYDFNIYVKKSDSCKMVPVYETKRVQVGIKVVCND